MKWLAAGSLVFLMTTGCATHDAIHGGAAALAKDLPFYIEHSQPLIILSPEEQATLNKGEQIELITKRYNRMKDLGNQLKATAAQLEEATR